MSNEVSYILKLDVKPYAESIKTAMTLNRLFEDSSKSIMRVRTPEINTSKVDAEVKKLENFLKRYETQAGKAADAGNKFANSNIQVKNSISNINPSLLQTAQNLAIVGQALYNIAQRGIQAAVELYNLGNTSNGLKQSFEGMAKREGVNAQETLSKIKLETKGVINEMNIMRLASRGKLFNIELEHIPILLKFAAIRAKEMGESVDFLADSIITGLGRKSPLILDNLGIQMSDLDKAVIKVAASHGRVITTVDESTRSLYLNEAAVMVAREQIEKSTLSLNDQIFEIDRAKTKFEELRTSIGEAFSEAVNQKITTVSDSLNSVGIEGASADGVLQGIVDTLINVGLGGVWIELLGKYLENAAEQGKIVVEWFNSMIDKFNETKNLLNEVPPDTFLGGIRDYLRAAAEEWASFVDGIINFRPDANFATVNNEVAQQFTGPVMKSGLFFAPKMATPTGTTKKSGSTGSTKKERKEELSELQEARKELERLNKLHTLNKDSVLAQLEIELKIAAVKTRIADLEAKIPPIRLKILDLSKEEMRQFEKVESKYKNMDELHKGIVKDMEDRVKGSDEFKTAELLYGSLADVAGEKMKGMWHGVFGEANSLLEQYIENATAKFIDFLAQFALQSILSSIFPLAGIIPSFFNGGGATAAGMPSGTGNSIAAGFSERAGAVNRLSRVQHSKMQIEIQGKLSGEDIELSGRRVANKISKLLTGS